MIIAPGVGLILTNPTTREMARSSILTSVSVPNADSLLLMTKMFNLQNQNCPKCDSPQYNGNISLEHLGIAKLRLIADTKCVSCDFSRQYTTSLE
jgi:hypothetical protein